MDVLLTGYSGNLGRAVCEQLIQASHDVHVLLHGSVIEPEAISNKIKIVWGSLLQHDVLDRETKNVDVVVHCAWDNRRTIDESLEKVNLGGTEKLLESAKRNKVRTFVHISSVAVYGLAKTLWGRTIDESQPLIGEEQSPDAYCSAKVLIEDYCNQAKGNSEMNIIIIRPGIFFSDIKAPAKKLFTSKNRSYALLVGNGRNHLPYIHVGDVARMIMAVIENPPQYAVYNCVPTVQLSCLEFLTKWGISRGIRMKVIRLQPFVVQFMNMLLQQAKRIMGKSTVGPSSDYQIASGIRDIHYSSQKAIKELGWQDVLTKAIAEMQFFLQ
jgi:nucleoside-diphosphate-sugar epimerase